MKPVTAKTEVNDQAVRPPPGEPNPVSRAAGADGLCHDSGSACQGAQAIVPTWKRVLDVSLIIVLLPLLVPFMCMIAVFIKMVSRGPVILRQERVGFMGRSFQCLKFRTMHCNADTTVHEKYTRELAHADVPMIKPEDLPVGDPRLIKFGGILRATGVDELPQLLNVLRGEMSLVGPRPCMPYEYEEYEEWHKERFLTLPGLTGLWQVSGKNRTTFNQMMNLDIDYVRRRSLWLDLKIILRTGPTLVGQVVEKIRAKRMAPSAGEARDAIPTGTGLC